MAESVEESDAVATEADAGKTLKGGHDPVEMAQRSAESRARNKAARVTDDDIVQALRKKAKSGDVNAARALLEWERRAASTDPLATDPLAWTVLLPRTQREQVMAWIGLALEAREQGRRDDSHAREGGATPPHDEPLAGGSSWGNPSQREAPAEDFPGDSDADSPSTPEKNPD